MSIIRRNTIAGNEAKKIAAAKAAEAKTLKKYSVKAGIEDLGFVHAVSKEKAVLSARRKFGAETKYAVYRYTITLVE